MKEDGCSFGYESFAVANPPAGSASERKRAAEAERDVRMGYDSCVIDLCVHVVHGRRRSILFVPSDRIVCTFVFRTERIFFLVVVQNCLITHSSSSGVKTPFIRACFGKKKSPGL